MKSVNKTIPKARAFDDVFAYLLEQRQICEQEELIDIEGWYATKLEAIEDVIDKMNEFLEHRIEEYRDT